MVDCVPSLSCGLCSLTVMLGLWQTCNDVYVQVFWFEMGTVGSRLNHNSQSQTAESRSRHQNWDSGIVYSRTAAI
ncbi:hypothetical protein L195_g009837 [Trifolium pratense]|uniref:Secreted protein n=1 Tax=Trifolium pratense TaxID=57577 RepID=A0A2K3NUQ5_TRIPR|nr:hypothetical protein L195_g003151 [Trifolium pratense]PNY06769.1 hypothetical protein L195_g003247 [Trifolium pratense]PNY13188.1 hypothetical protein L195_g009837 [Trifolium pratense]